MPIDLMLALLLLIEALESRLAEVVDEEEIRRTRETLIRMDGLLEKCLACRFTERDRLTAKTTKELKAARRKALRWRESQIPWNGFLSEISALMSRLDALWVEAENGR